MGKRRIVRVIYQGIPFRGTPERIVQKMGKVLPFGGAEERRKYMIGVAHRVRIMYGVEIDSEHEEVFLRNLELIGEIEILEDEEQIECAE